LVNFLLKFGFSGPFSPNEILAFLKLLMTKFGRLGGLATLGKNLVFEIKQF
jgi:hypothetical protein